MDQMADCSFCGLTLCNETNGEDIKYTVYLGMTPREPYRVFTHSLMSQ